MSQTTNPCADLDLRDGIHQKAFTSLVLVGQAPGKHPKYKPELALFWLPANSTGAKLCDKMAIPRREYTRLERHNVLDFYPGAMPGGGDHFPRGMAKTAAAKLSEQLFGKHVLLVGATTALSFGFGKHREPFIWYASKANVMAFIPHLSGVNRWWNDPSNAVEGTQWLYEVGQAWMSTKPDFRPPQHHKVVLDEE